jgi:hypothetical protein
LLPRQTVVGAGGFDARLDTRISVLAQQRGSAANPDPHVHRYRDMAEGQGL